MDFNFLSKTILFRGITPQDIQSLMVCLNATTKKYKKNEFILYSGGNTSFMGMFFQAVFQSKMMIYGVTEVFLI